MGRIIDSVLTLPKRSVTDISSVEDAEEAVTSNICMQEVEGKVSVPLLAAPRGMSYEMLCSGSFLLQTCFTSSGVPFSVTVTVQPGS